MTIKGERAALIAAQGTMTIGLYWHQLKESNPYLMGWNHLCYRYTKLILEATRDGFFKMDDVVRTLRQRDSNPQLPLPAGISPYYYYAAKEACRPHLRKYLLYVHQ